MAEKCPMNLGSVTSDENRSNPIPFFRKLHKEAPVYLDPVINGYVVTRYADVSWVYDHPELFSSQADVLTGRARSEVAKEAMRRFEQHGFPEVHTMTTSDPPEHGRYRGLVDKAFNMGFVREAEPSIRRIANELIDGFIERGKADFYNEFAILLPMYVILDKLGLPRADWKRVKRWSDALMERIDTVLEPERELALVDEIIEMQNYVFSYLEKYRKDPQENLLTQFATIEVDGAPLSDAEAVSVSYLVMVGGNETSTSAMLSAFNTLLTNPDVFKTLKEQPELIKQFVEESLRVHTPVPMTYRRAKVDTEINGTPIPKDSMVLLANMGGNVDPEKWPNPEEIDFARKGARNHLAFGRGLHFCVGALLARAEMRVALELVLERLANVRLSSDHPAPKYTPHSFVHCVDQMHIEFEPGQPMASDNSSG